MTDEKKLARNQKDTNDDMLNLVDNLKRQEDLKYNRRAFLKTAVGASVVLGVATIPFSVKAMLGIEKEYYRVGIASLSEIPIGESLVFSYPTEKDSAILVHTVNGDLKAYNNSCTHLMCPVFYEKTQDVLMCPCHKGYFDVNSGQPKSGPPQRELPLIEIEVEDGVVYAVGRQYRHG